MYITLFEDTYSPVLPEKMIDAEWEDISAFLTSYSDAPEKTGTYLFNLWEFKTSNYKQRDDGGISRCKENAISCNGLILDIDNSENATSPILMQDVIDNLKQYEFILYTTWNHKRDKTTGVYDGKFDRFRVVLPFASPVTFDEMVAKKQAFLDNINFVDPASFSATQCFYLHSGIRHYSYTHINHGEFINPNDFKSVDPVFIPTYPTKKQTSNPLYTKTVLKHLGQITGLHNDEALKLAVCVKGSGGDLTDYFMLCDTTFAPDSTHIKKPRTALTEEFNKVGDFIKKDTVDKFLMDHGVKRLPISLLR